MNLAFHLISGATEIRLVANGCDGSQHAIYKEDTFWRVSTIAYFGQNCEEIGMAFDHQDARTWTQYLALFSGCTYNFRNLAFEAG